MNATDAIEAGRRDVMDGLVRAAAASGWARAAASLLDDDVVRTATDAIHRSDVNDDTDLSVEDDYDRAARVALAAASLALTKSNPYATDEAATLVERPSREDAVAKIGAALYDGGIDDAGFDGLIATVATIAYDALFGDT